MDMEVVQVLKVKVWENLPFMIGEMVRPLKFIIGFWISLVKLNS